MNATQLLAHFDRLAEAPNAVPRLRRFILDLAVRGKLVEQDMGDEPATELLKQISKANRELIEAKLLKKIAASTALTANDLPFTLPEGWALTRLGNAYDVRDGTHATPKYVEVGFPLVTSKNLSSGYLDLDHVRLISKVDHQDISLRSRVDRNDILFAMIGSIGNPVIVDTDRPFSIKNVALFKYYAAALSNPRFLLLFLQHAAYDMRTGATGGLQPFVSLGMLRSSPIAFPPLAEQHRIVAKVDELMALCDQLEAAQQERERRRDSLAAASLQRLNQPAADTTPDAQREYARFHLDHLPSLTTRPEHIKAMRKLILDSAIKGKLVAQDPVDEPANELVKRIHDRKLALIKQKLLKADKALPSIKAEEKRFVLSKGWVWCRLGNLAHFVTSGSRDWAKHYSDTGPIFVRMGNLSRDSYQLRMANVQRVNPPKDGEGKRTSLEAGDVLISITGEVGLLGLIPPNFGEAYINQHTCMVRPSPELSSRYLPELFRSTFAQAQFDAPQRGLKNSFRLTDVTEFLVPLPPLAEQHRIVAKIDELMALCDQLETQLTTTQTDSRRLLEAVLEVALAPA